MQCRNANFHALWRQVDQGTPRRLEMKYKPSTDNSFNSLLDAKLTSDRPLWDQGRSAAVAMSVRMGDSNTILEAQLGSAGSSELATIANAARTAAKAAVPEPSIEAVVEGFRSAAQHQADSMHQFMLDTALGRGRLNQKMFNSLAERLGFYPVNADTFKKADDRQRGVSCPSEENSATSSSVRQSA